jgi:hypothetical protein
MRLWTLQNAKCICSLTGYYLSGPTHEHVVASAEVHRRFGGKYCFHPQGRGVNEATNILHRKVNEVRSQRMPEAFRNRHCANRISNKEYCA